MAVTKTRSSKAGTSKASTSKATRADRKSASTKASTSAKAKAAETDGPSKREAQREQNAKLRARVVELREAETSWGEIAEELSITPGKAQFLMMQQAVEDNPRQLKIKWTDDESLVAGITAAREANDRHSSWGWIAARTGVSEGKVKSLAEEAGLEVKGSNVAVSRAEANGTAKKADGKTAKQAGRTTKTPAAKAAASTASAKTTAARKRAAKRAGKNADPS